MPIKKGGEVGHATKGGMYCKRCDKPVAAQKTTHGLRNATAIFTYGVTGKIEQWHCPDCGGPVVTQRAAEQAVGKAVKAERRRRDRQETLHEVGDQPVDIVINALPKPMKKATAWANFRSFEAICKATGTKGKAKKRLRQELEAPPAAIHGLSGRSAGNLVFELRDAGAKVDVVPVAAK